MREIKFKGIRKNNGKWIFGNYVFDHAFGGNEKHYIYVLETLDVLTDFVRYEILPETLGQFTGLKDKNGKEIYEGDKIRLSNEYSICGQIPREGYIVWLNDKSMYVIVQENNINDIWHNHIELHKLPIYNYEVIGNIHEAQE